VGCGSGGSSGSKSYLFSGNSDFNMKSVVTQSEIASDIGKEVNLNINVKANVNDNSLVDITMNSITKTVGMENKGTLKFALIENEDGGETTSIITIQFISDDLSTFSGANSWKFSINNQIFSGASNISGSKISGDLQFIKE
jgi:hypothetical protein